MSKRTKMIQNALGKDAVKVALNRLEEDDRLSLEKMLLGTKEELRKHERALEDNLKNPSLVLGASTVTTVENIQFEKNRIAVIEQIIKDYLSE